MTEPRIVICMPVAAGPPRIPAWVRTCDKCGEEVWLSQKYTAQEGDLFRCVPCAAPDIRHPESIVEAAPWTSADFATALKEILRENKP